ncbi:uncharacterized protein [Pocillopora verrucosa]|uniref:uncharacterized protein isoform X6 n=1 Tax=Pocillopora verrucosa TaxID=203993 RepID=UPI003340EA5D
MPRLPQKQMQHRKWQGKLDELHVFFKKLCKSCKKPLFKEEDALLTSVANIQLELVKRVCREWKEIALMTCEKVFKETEQEEIDLFDVKCKEWGFLLRELFGSSLGTDDYRHLLIDHAPMLMRRFLSMREFSQQGFEASHKEQCQLWLKASSHDRHGEASSIEQMLVHFYTERMLFLHLCREAIKSVEAKNGKQDGRYTFYFAGCGWKLKEEMCLFIPVCRSGHWFLALIYNLPFLVGKARMDKNSQS